MTLLEIQQVQCKENPQDGTLLTFNIASNDILEILAECENEN